MNKRGFTLVEVLAVLALLSVIMIIATVSINGIRSKIDKNLFSTKLEYIINGAETWGQDNRSALVQNDATTTVGTLLSNGYLETDETKTYGACESGNSVNGKCQVITDNTNGKVINALEIKVYLENNRVYGCILKSANNQNLLEEESDFSKYGSLDIYC